MRQTWLSLIGLGLPVILTGQVAPASGNGAGSLQLPGIEGLGAPAATPNATTVLNVKADLPASVIFPVGLYNQQANSLAKLTASSLMPETRTPAQLDAILNGYVGRWQGEVFMRVVGVNRLITFPIEMIYTMEQEKGRKTLLCTTKYTFNGRAVVEQQRTWIQNGRLMSESSGNGRNRRFVVYSRGDSLVWMLDDTRRSPFDFYHSETLNLTAAGGQLLMNDFEATSSQRGMILLSQVSELKLVK